MNALAASIRNNLSGLILATVIMFSGGLLAGCGGGGGGGTQPSSATAGVSFGRITAIGSILVNGITFETDSTRFEIEGDESSSLGDLRRGMIVEVEGTFNADGFTGTADVIRFKDNLEGPITSVITSSTGLEKTLQVLGQTVIVKDPLTVFAKNDPLFDSFAELDASDVDKVIEVSGLPDGDGSIKATFIQKKADSSAEFVGNGGEFEVKGHISNLDPVASTLNIGTLEINFSSVTPRDLENAPNGVLEDGLPVEVKGSLLVGNTLTASDLEIELEGLGRAELARAEVQGLIANFDDVNETFTLNGQLVRFANAQVFLGTKADLASGLSVEAQGPIVSGGLDATIIFFEGANFTFEAAAIGVDVQNGNFNL